MAKQRFRHLKKGSIPLEKETVRYASAGEKIKAFLTDAFMLLMPIMYIVFYLLMEGREGFAQHKLLGWSFILIPLIFVQTLFMYFTGQTPGYKAYNLKVIDENSKKKPSFEIILWRNISAILSFFTLLGWIIMFFRKDSKTLHDLLSATAVVYCDD